MSLLLLVRREMRRGSALLLDQIAPRHCPACGGPAGVGALCDPCAQDLERRVAPQCDRCGGPLGLPGARCRGEHRELAGFAFARAPFAYRGSGGAVVRRLKFGHDLLAARFLARAMAREIAAWARGPGRRARVVSVPLHPRKRRQRRIDQAALLADLVAAETGLGLWPGLLCRQRETLPQADPRVVSRAANVAGAFTVRRRSGCPGATLVLVDDVRTSGSTALECGRALRAAGARQLVLLTATQA
jgi:predicted amidophosphoribosyltransferase